MIVAMKLANKARGTVWRSWWRSVAPGNRKIQHTPTQRLRVSHGWTGYGYGLVADPLTIDLPLNGHVRICAGVPGKPGAYRDRIVE